MKSFNTYLIEKRRNPDQNPKISAYEALKPYKDDPSIYITFTGIDKVGINPHSNFNTPNGIYTYPLKEIWQGFDHNKGHVVVPFAGEAPFVWILKESCSKMQVISEYNSSDYDNDMNKIRKLYSDKKILTSLKSMVDKGFSKNWVGISKQLAFLYDTVKVKKEPTQNNIGKFDDHFTFDKDAIEKVVQDNGSDSLLQDISDEITLSDRLVNGEIGVPKLRGMVFKRDVEAYFNKELKGLADSGLSGVDILINDATQKAIKKNPFSAFWNVTRWIAYNGNPDGTGFAIGMDMAKYKSIDLGKGVKFSTNKTAQTWNNILRLLGYCGFADKQGTGSIHPSEPMQAVFLSKNGFTVLDKWHNINPRKIYKTVKEISKSNYGIDELVEEGEFLVLNKSILPNVAMAMIPKKDIKWTGDNIVEIIRGIGLDIFRKRNPYMKKVFHDNLWKMPERDFRHFLNKITQEGGYRNPDSVATKLIASLQKEKSNPKSIKYVQNWLDSGKV